MAVNVYCVNHISEKGRRPHWPKFCHKQKEDNEYSLKSKVKYTVENDALQCKLNSKI